MSDKVYRVLIRRTTLEYLEVEVEAPSLADAITKAPEDPYGYPELRSWDDAQEDWEIIEAEEMEGE